MLHGLHVLEVHSWQGRSAEAGEPMQLDMLEQRGWLIVSVEDCGRIGIFDLDAEGDL